MKRRIQIDSAMLFIVILGTAVLFNFRKIYLSNEFLDNILDFFGLMLILDGQLLRMTARGHKKKFSDQGQQLVTTGPYGLVRNPMYLGSFLVGAGFILILWPWWIFPIFTILFWERFSHEMNKEETLLFEKFGGVYKIYSQRVPRLFPSLLKWKEVIKFKIAFKKTFNWQEALSTKEKRGLWLWLSLVFIFDLLQEWSIYGQMHFGLNITVFISSISMYAVICAIIVKKI